VASVKFLTSGFGARNPVAPNRNPDGSDNPEGRQLNRRVTLIIHK
jgi:outer membrane protein OmpA-like peptidoglycan-associated protein